MKTRKEYRALLDRAHGYTACASRMLPKRRMPAASQRAWNLAQAISARYAAIERRWPVMALVFEQPGRNDVLVSHTYHTTHPSIFMNPRVILRMLISHREEVKRVVAERTQEIHRVVAERTPAQPIGRDAVPMTLAASPGRKLESQEQDEVVARIVRRAVRNENPVRENFRQSERSPVHVAQVAPVEDAASVQSPSLVRVFRHAAKSRDDTAAAAATVRTGREMPGVVAGRDANAASAVQTTVDITRITDQVMQALDRRIVAQRERMGRV